MKKGGLADSATLNIPYSPCFPYTHLDTCPKYHPYGCFLASSSGQTILVLCFARKVCCLCSADLQPLPLKHNYPCFQVFLHFPTSHCTQHQLVREHHRMPFLDSQRQCVDRCSFLYTSLVAAMQRLTLLLTFLV